MKKGYQLDLALLMVCGLTLTAAVAHSQTLDGDHVFWSSTPVIAGKTAVGQINGIPYTFTSTQELSATPEIYNYSLFAASGEAGFPNVTTIQNSKKSENTLSFETPISNPLLVFASIGNSSGLSVPIQFYDDIEVIWHQNVEIEPKRIIGTEGYAIVRVPGTFTELKFDYLQDEHYVNFLFGAHFPNCEDKFHWSGAPSFDGNVATGSIDGIAYQYTSSEPIQVSQSIYNKGTFPESFHMPNTAVIKNVEATTNTLKFDHPTKNPTLVFASIGSGAQNQSVDVVFEQEVQLLFNENVVVSADKKTVTGTEGYAIVEIPGEHSEITFRYTKRENYANFLFGATFCRN